MLSEKMICKLKERLSEVSGNNSNGFKDYAKMEQILRILEKNDDKK